MKQSFLTHSIAWYVCAVWELCNSPYPFFDKFSDDVSGVDIHGNESCDDVPMDFG